MPNRIALVLVALGCATAVASPAETGSPRFVLAMNEPLGWLPATQARPTLVAVSAYVGLGRHHVVRANVSDYVPDGWASTIEEEGRSGDVTDVGVGWMYFPCERLRGLSIELGVLGRRRAVYDYLIDKDLRHTSTFTVGARALVGWSWLVGVHLYLSVAGGASVGRESGTEVVMPYTTNLEQTSRVHRTDREWESFARVGWAFNL